MEIQSQKEKDDLEQSNGTLSVDLADKEKQIGMAISENRDGKIPRVGSNGRGNEDAPKRKKNGAT